MNGEYFEIVFELIFELLVNTVLVISGGVYSKNRII